jgi:hypothetical protein
MGKVTIRTREEDVIFQVKEESIEVLIKSMKILDLYNLTVECQG